MPTAPTVAVCGSEGAHCGRPSARVAQASCHPATCHSANFLHSGLLGHPLHLEQHGGANRAHADALRAGIRDPCGANTVGHRRRPRGAGSGCRVLDDGDSSDRCGGCRTAHRTVSVGCDSRSARVARAQSCSITENVLHACQRMRVGSRASSRSSHAVSGARPPYTPCAPRQVSASSSVWTRPHSGRGS